MIIKLYELVRIGEIFKRVYGVKDLYDAKYRVTTNVDVTAKMLFERGYSSEHIKNVLRERLFFIWPSKLDNNFL